MKAPIPATGRCWLDMSPPLSFPGRVRNESFAMARYITPAMSPLCAVSRAT
jgi:hypothetical protein